LDKRTLLALILCGAVTLLWMVNASQVQRERAARGATQKATTKPKQPAATEAVPTAEVGMAASASNEKHEQPVPPTAPTHAVPLPPEPAPATHELETDLYRLTFSNRGGCLVRAQLKQFYSDHTRAPGRELTILDTPPGVVGSLVVRDPKGMQPYDTRFYEYDAKASARQPNCIVYRAHFADGLEIIKEFVVPPNRYHIELIVTVLNTSSQPIKVRYALDGAARLVPEFPGEPNLLLVRGVAPAPERVATESEPPHALRKGEWTFQNQSARPLLWVGTSDKYFAAVLQPEPRPGRDTSERIFLATARLLPECDAVVRRDGSEQSRRDNAVVSVETTPIEVAPGEERDKDTADRYLLYLGPKDTRILAGGDYRGLTALVDYGFFGSISRILLAILNVFHSIVGNYGVAIIFLTLLVRVVLYPLSRKQQISMHRMQRLQPLIKELQQKYKNDRQRLGQEQMRLFKEHGINPLAGCLPLLLQLPIFIGLFSALQRSIDLRQAGFVLWIKDLSRADTIAYLGNFPVNILPVLMVISWVAQQMTMPRPVDPEQARQQKMMLFMPVLFGFMLYSTASGLTLYWLTSTFFGILEQKYIKHQIARLEAEGKLGPAPSAGGSANLAETRNR